MQSTTEFRDATGFKMILGETVLFADSEGTNLYKGIIQEFGEEMVSVERIGTGWPRKVRRYPEQLVVVQN